MSPIHRRGDGRAEAGPTWGHLVERQIQEAQQRGDFDDLPYRGQRLPLPDDTYAGEMALAFSMLRHAGLAPPWIEANKEVRRLLAERERALARVRAAGGLPSSLGRRRHAELIGAINKAVDRLNAEAPTEAQHRIRLSLTAELAAFDAAWSGGGATAGPGDSPGPTRVGRNGRT